MKDYTLYVFTQTGTGKPYAAYYPTKEFSHFMEEGIFKVEKMYLHQTFEEAVMPSVHLFLIVINGQKLVYVTYGADDPKEAEQLMDSKITSISKNRYNWISCQSIRYGLNELKFKL